MQKFTSNKKKYEFTGERRVVYNKTLRRIRALIDIPAFKVKKGDLGGWIESEKNLSHLGKCWVFDNATVRDSALVSGNARVYDDSTIYCNATIKGDTVILGNATIAGNAKISDAARISESARISGRAMVNVDAIVTGNAIVRGSAKITDCSLISGEAIITGSAVIKRNAIISGNAEINCGTISTNAYIGSNDDIISITNIGDKRAAFNDIASFYKCMHRTTRDIYIDFSYAEMEGALEEFSKLVNMNDQRLKDRILQLVKVKFGLE